MKKAIGTALAAMALAGASPAGAADVIRGNFLATEPFSIAAPMRGERDLKIVVFSKSTTFSYFSVSLEYELFHIEAPELDYYIGLMSQPVSTFRYGTAPNLATIYVQPPKCDYSVQGGCSLRLNESLRIDGAPSFAGGGRVHFYVTPVPEPSAWALLIAGFGIAGAGLRIARGQRRVQLAPQPAS